jgi:hypothetical protein
MSTYNTWEHFRVKKKFTFLPLRICQYSSNRTLWSWMKTTYILQRKCYHADADNPINWIQSYFYNHFWENSRMSDVEEFDEYQTWLKSNE